MTTASHWRDAVVTRDPRSRLASFDSSRSAAPTAARSRASRAGGSGSAFGSAFEMRMVNSYCSTTTTHGRHPHRCTRNSSRTSTVSSPDT
ncbi:MAG: hypothetical protein U0871_00305 [Gemmataceae bacterium]